MIHNPRLRLTTRPPSAPPPPAGTVDIVYDSELGILMAEDSAGNRTGVSGISIDMEGNLPVNALVFADTGGVALAEGALGLNTLGQLVLHDGVDTGDQLPPAIFEQRIRGEHAVSGAQNIAGTNQLVASFKIPASKAAVGVSYRIIGRFSVGFSAATNTPPYKLGFTSAYSAAADIGVGYVNAAVCAAQQMPFFMLELEFNAADPGEFVIQPVNTNLGLLLYGNPGVDIKSDAPVPPLGSGPELGEEGEYQLLGLYYYAPATASAPGCVITYDFTLEEI